MNTPNHGSVEMTRQRLHVVLHGLIALRLSWSTRTAQLLVPSVPMHFYHYGSFHDLKNLPTGQDYHLGGVQAGYFEPNTDVTAAKKAEHLAVCLGERNLTCQARGTHATIHLPWPNQMHGVRQIMNAPEVMFPGSGVNPRYIYYITYLTYNVLNGDWPVLTKCCKPVWEAPREENEDIRLHFFADDPAGAGEHYDHAVDAYKRLSDQVLGGGLALVPDVSAREDGGWKYNRKSEHEDEVPSQEAVDFVKIGEPPGVHPMTIGDGGNCLPAVLFD